MNNHRAHSIESQWARLGVLFNCAPAPRTPDLERLLLATARELAGNARLFPLAVTWLVEHGASVARHRLRRLVISELELAHRPVFGLVLESAIEHGAGRELSIAAEPCRPATPERPLFDAARGAVALEAVAARHASGLSRRWGVWAPEVVLKRDALRPGEWLLAHNASFRDRMIRKGDLRCSILESLRRDTSGSVGSESELARLSGATRAAVRKALASLVREGEVTTFCPPGNRRDHGVSVANAA